MSELILFQGDSITDCGRSRDSIIRQGYGYATMVQGQLGYNCPGKYSFINKGISGNRIVDVYARIKCDIINLKPDYMSLLIGVNDVWHEIGGCNGVATPKFEKIYTMLIEEIKEELPDIKLMLLEPFVLPGRATVSAEDETVWQRFDTNVKANAAAVKRIAEKFDIPFIPLQEGFEKLSEICPPDYWLDDGVHPTAMGHAFIKEQWMKCFAENYGK